MEKRLVYFFIAFGCWIGAWDTILAFVIYNIWATVAWVWCVASGIALLGMLTKEKTKIYAAKTFSNEAVENGCMLALISFASYTLAGEIALAVAVAVTTVPFAFFIMHTKEKIENPKKRK